MPFFLPLVPILYIGGGIIVGAVLSGDNSEAQVVVNTAPTQPQNSIAQALTGSFSSAALLGGTALAAVIIGPKIVRELRK